MPTEVTPGKLADDRIAVVYLRPSDVPADPSLVYTADELTAHYFGPDSPVRKFWTEVSHGNYRYTGKVFYPDALPQTMADLMAAKQPDNPFVLPTLMRLSGAKGLVVPGLDLDAYDLVFVLVGEPAKAHQLLFAGGFVTTQIAVNDKTRRMRTISFVMRRFARGYPFAVVAEGRKFEDVRLERDVDYPELGLWFDDDTILHEWGHSLGLQAHAHFLRVQQEPMQGEVEVYSPKKFVIGDDYGDYFDVMGTAAYALHLNAGNQDKLGWLGPENITRVTRSTRGVTLTPLEGSGTVRAAAITPLDPVALTLPASAPPEWSTTIEKTCRAAQFYVEYRQGVGFDRHLANPYMVANTRGLLIHLVMALDVPERQTWLLDMSPDETASAPQSFDDHHLAALLPGYRFHDPHSRTLIRNLRAVGTTGMAFDVVLATLPSVPAGVTVDPPSALLKLIGATASSEVVEPYNGRPQTAARLIEGPNDDGCYWSSAITGDLTAWIQVELECLSLVSAIRIRWMMFESSHGRPMAYRVKASVDGTTWVDTGVSQADVVGLTPRTTADSLPGLSEPARFLRFEMSDTTHDPKYWFPNWASLSANLPPAQRDRVVRDNSSFACYYVLVDGIPVGPPQTATAAPSPSAAANPALQPTHA